MKKFSKNKKLNNVLTDIYVEISESMELSEIKEYVKSFPYESDYNIYQYGNLLIYDCDIKDLYKNYKSLQNANIDKLIDIYKRQVGYIARTILQDATK